MSPVILSDREYAFLGAGIIAGVFAERLIRGGGVPAQRITASDLDAEKAAALAARLGIRPARSNPEAAAAGDVVFLAVPPNAVLPVLDEVRNALRPGALIVSLAAVIETSWMEERAGASVKIVRVIPNTPSLAGAGMNPHCLGRSVAAGDLPFLDALLAVFGETIRLEEPLMEAATALTAVGPTYFFPVLEALRDAAVQAGLPQEVAERAAAATAAGAARLVTETGRAPEELKQMIGARTLAEPEAKALFASAYQMAFEKLAAARRKLAPAGKQAGA
jgi:pyrroline-5-carboxylate reductase